MTQRAFRSIVATAVGLAAAIAVLGVAAPQVDAAENSMFLPYRKGTAHTLTQGPGGSFSHNKTSTRYAYDFGLPQGTPVLSAAAGKIIFAGDRDDGFGNQIVIQHSTGVCTQYAHLSSIWAKTTGQTVGRGVIIGLSGGAKGTPGAGYSEGAHLHFSGTTCVVGPTVSTKVTFVERTGTSPSWTSQNAPAAASGTKYLRNYNSGGATQHKFSYGRRGDVPVAGNWDGVGGDTTGVYRDGNWYLRNYNSAGTTQRQFAFGRATDIPVVGDWNGDGIDTIGVFRNGTWYLRNYNSAGAHNISFGYGKATDIPVTGNWDGVGGDTIGVFRNGTWYLRNYNSAGATQHKFGYGRIGDLPLTGDWDGHVGDTIGVAR